MPLLIVSFLAGILTVAAPCILPLLPVVVGGSLMGGGPELATRRRWRPVVIAGSLAVSIIIFSLLLKATTALLGVPTSVWQIVSGVIVLLVGAHFLWPHGWETVARRSGLFGQSNAVLGRAMQHGSGWGGAVLIGAALGPVFSSCSPTYFLIVAAILPASFWEGLAYLAAYALGVATSLLLIAYVGQAVTQRLRLVSNPIGYFRRIVGALFIAVGLMVLLGLDKKIQTFVLDRGWYAPVSNLEMRLRD